MFSSPRRPWLLALLAGASGILLGCNRADGPTASANDPKAEIQRFLSKQTGQKQFTPGMDLNLPTEVATLREKSAALERKALALRASLQSLPAAPASSMRATLEAQLQQAEQDCELAKREASRKAEELSQQENTYIRAVRQQMAGVRSYDAMYRLIGQQLATADALLAEENRDRRRMGLMMAREACGHANAGGVDTWLAARICEAYFWPNLDLADTEGGSRERALDLLETSRRVFFATDETNHVLKNYTLLMSNAPNAKAADTFRVQLADWLEEKGSLKHAAEILGEIRDTEVLASAQERISRVRERVAGRP